MADPLSTTEMNDMRTDIALLKQSTSDTLEAIHQQADSQVELMGAMHGLTSEIREDRIRRELHDELQATQDEFLKTQVTSNSNRLDHFRDRYKPAIDRLIVSHNRYDTMIKSIFSGTGGIILVLVCTAVLYFLGINPKDFKS